MNTLFDNDGDDIAFCEITRASERSYKHQSAIRPKYNHGRSVRHACFWPRAPDNSWRRRDTSDLDTTTRVTRILARNYAALREKGIQ